MKRGSTIFLKTVILLIGIVVLLGIIRFPPTEGRSANLDPFSIYFRDPFLWYLYFASLPFFVGLYQAFELLGFIGQNKVFSLNSVKALRIIKYCAIVQGILIVLAILYIRIFVKGDDPAGAIALGVITAFFSAVIATAAAVFEKLLQSAVDLKSENDLTI